MDHINKLNKLIQAGRIITTRKCFSGARDAMLADGSAGIRDITAYPQGQPGALFYLQNGYELIANGKTVARWACGPKDSGMSHKAYMRATRWLLLKAQKQLT